MSGKNTRRRSVLLNIQPGLICRRKYPGTGKKYIVVLEWISSRGLWKIRSWNNRKKIPNGTTAYVSPDTFWDQYDEFGCRMPKVGDDIQSLAELPSIKERETAIIKHVGSEASSLGVMLTIKYAKCVLGVSAPLTEAKTFTMKASLSTYWQAFYTLDTKQEKKKGKKAD
jgi:hypothetical protein